MISSSDHTVPPAFDPIRVVLEYVGDRDVARRLSAAAALRAIGTKEAAVQLVKMALAEESRADRERIVDELTALLTAKATQTWPADDLWTELLKGTRSEAREQRLRAFDVVLSLHERNVLEQSDRAVATVVDAAVGDGAASFEDVVDPLAGRAEDALVTMPPWQHHRIGAALIDLAGGARRPYVTLLRGRLSRRGFPVGQLALEPARATRSGSLWRRQWNRVAAAWEVADAHDPPSLPSRLLQKRVVVPALLAAFSGAALVSMSVAAFASRSALPSLAVFYPLLVLVSVMIGLVAAMAATSRSTPFFVQHDVLAAIVAATARAVTFTSIVATLLVLILMLVWGLRSKEAVLIGVVTLLLAVAVRLGTIAGFLAIPAGVWKGERLWWWPTQLFAILAGSGAGLALLFALRGAYPREVSDAALIFLAPSTGAMASAFAVLDRPASLKGSKPAIVRLGGGAVPAVILAGVAVVAVLLPIVGVTARRQHEEFRRAEPGETLEIPAVSIDPRRAEVLFAVAFPQDVVLRPNAPQPGDRMSLFYKQPLGVYKGQPLCDAEAPDALLSDHIGRTKLVWGCFKGVLQRAESNESATAALVRAVLRVRLGINSDGVTAELNPTKVPAEITVVQAGQDYRLPPGPSDWLLTEGTLSFSVDATAALLQLDAVRSPNLAVAVVQDLSGGGCKSVLRFGAGRALVEAADDDFDVPSRIRARTDSNLVAVTPGRYRLITSRTDDRQAPDECAKSAATSLPTPSSSIASRRAEAVAPPSGFTITRSAILESGVTFARATTAEVFTGAWLIVEAPSNTDFALLEPRRVTIRIPQPPEDLDLELLNVTDPKPLSIAKVDDPEEVSKVLQPGRYRVVVRNREGQGMIDPTAIQIRLNRPDARR